MLKAKRLKSMFVLYSACAVMATGFTSQAASEQPEVTTITETKGENTNTHTAVQAISQNIVASAQEMTDVSQQVIADNIAKKEEEERLAKEKAEQEAQEKAEREAREAYVRANHEPCQEWMLSEFYRRSHLSVRTVWTGCDRMAEQSQKFKGIFTDGSASRCRCAEWLESDRKLPVF